MKLTKIEQKQFIKIKNEIVELATLDTVDEYDDFFDEDVEDRIINIDALIKLLNKEKAMLKDIK
jgi:hypothetical protein